MIGINALSHDVEEKAAWLLNQPQIGFIEYGIDRIEDIQFLKDWQQPRPFRWAFHLPLTVNPCLYEKPLRSAQMAWLRDLIEQAARFDPLYFVMHGGFVPAWQWNRGNLEKKRLLALCANFLEGLQQNFSHLDFYLENTWSRLQGPGPDLQSFATDVQTVEALLLNRSLGWRFCYDIGHAYLAKEDFSKSPLLQGSLLHLSSNGGENDEHQAVGEGFLNPKQARALLKDERFRHVTVEMSRLAAEKSFRVLKEELYD